MNDTGILLIGHGSSLPFNELVFNKIKEKIETKLEIKTEMSYVKLSEPSIEDGIKKLNKTNIIAQPLMICEGRITKEKIPKQLPDNVKLLNTIGANPNLCKIINSKIKKALSKSKLDDVSTEVIMLSHGSKLDYNEKFIKDIASQMDCEYPLSYAFMKYNEPSLNDIFKTVNSKRTVVVPLFVTDGIHTMTDIPIILGLMDAPEPCPFMKDGKHHPDHGNMHGHNDDPAHRPQHHSLEAIEYSGEVMLADSMGDDDILISLWCENILENI